VCTCFQRTVAVFCTALTLVVCGCKGEHARSPVQGTITYKGAPLDHGEIRFSPKDATGGTMEGSLINKNGKYTIPAEKGLFPGEYQVSISAPDLKGSGPAGEAPGRSRYSKDLLPEKYNVKSELHIEISPSGKREFNFDLD
jgi:hypothetical protein